MGIFIERDLMWQRTEFNGRSIAGPHLSLFSPALSLFLSLPLLLAV